MVQTYAGEAFHRYVLVEVNMRKVTAMLKKLWKDESGQGATEYILLLVVVVALALLFRTRIMDALSAKLDQLSQDIGGFTGGN